MNAVAGQPRRARPADAVNVIVRDGVDVEVHYMAERLDVDRAGDVGRDEHADTCLS